MNRFAQRSAQTELIDEPGIPVSDWEVCLKELNMVNSFLGGHKITLEGVKFLLGTDNIKQDIIISEIGCGGGDNIKAIHNWHQKRIKRNNNTHLQYVGIDINKACIGFAAMNCKDLDAAFICSDYRIAHFENKPDIIFNSLFCHHFTNDQLVEMLIWMKHNSTKGFFINDLQRHPVAYHSIKILTQIFSRSYLVKNDGPISVLRGFYKNEWEQLLAKAGITKYTIHWRWAFRYIVIVKNE